MALLSISPFRTSDDPDLLAERVSRVLGMPTGEGGAAGFAQPHSPHGPGGAGLGGDESDREESDADRYAGCGAGPPSAPDGVGRRSPNSGPGGRRRRSRTQSGWAGWRERLSERWPLRLDPGRSGAVAVGAVLVVVLIAVIGWLVLSRPRPVAVAASAANGAVPVMTTPSGSAALAAPSTPAATSSAPGAVGTVSTSPAAMLVVDVAGRVVRPGVYRLPAGSRVDDALHAAGGARAGVDLTDLNLAALLTDGEQIAVGRTGANGTPGTAPDGSATEPTAAAADPATGTTTGASVDINTATLEQLETLPRVGPVLGQKIIDWRTAHNGFASVDQLNEVSGIGDITFAGLRPLVTV